MSNRFSAIAAKDSKPRPRQKEGAKERDADGGQEAPRSGTAEKDVDSKGFRLVESKKSQKAKAPAAAQSTASAQPAQPKKVRPTPSKWVGVPVGASPVDPEEERREKKAAAALRKHIARQVAGVKPAAPAAAHEAEDPSNLASLEAQLSAPSTAPSGGRGKRHMDANSWGSNPSPAPKSAQAGRSIELSTKSKKPIAKSAAEGPVIDHSRCEDGSVVAQVQFGVVAGKDAVIRLDPNAQDQTVLNAAFALAEQLRQGQPVKGGFYIASEAHEFSNEKTFDEPWMVDSLYKALAHIASGESTAKAYPYWHPAQGKAEPVEGEITITVFSPTALTLQHDSKARITVKSLRAHKEELFKSFVAQGHLLLAVVGQVRQLLQSDPRAEKMMDGWMQRLPVRLEGYLEQLEKAC